MASSRITQYIVCIKRTLGADTVEPSLSWIFLFFENDTDDYYFILPVGCSM